MGLIGSILVAAFGLVATILVATLSRLLAEDLKAWVPRLTGHAIERAIRKLPADQRDRLAEQWAADVADIPGDLSKLAFAFDLTRASTRIARDDQRRTSSEASPKAKANPASAALAITLDIANATYTKQPVPKAPGP